MVDDQNLDELTIVLRKLISGTIWRRKVYDQSFAVNQVW